MDTNSKISELNTRRAKALERFYAGTKMAEAADREVSSLSTQIQTMMDMQKEAGQTTEAAE